MQTGTVKTAKTLEAGKTEAAPLTRYNLGEVISMFWVSASLSVKLGL